MAEHNSILNALWKQLLTGGGDELNLNEDAVCLRLITSGLTISAAGAFSGLTFASLTVSQTGLGTTSTDGIVVTNTTAATGAATVQMSPRLRLRGNAWDTAASKTLDWILENRPTSNATPFSTLKFGSSLNGAAPVYSMELQSGSSAVLTVVGSIIAQAGTTGILGGSTFYGGSSAQSTTVANDGNQTAQMTIYGGTHATKANVIEFYNNSVLTSFFSATGVLRVTAGLQVGTGTFASELIEAQASAASTKVRVVNTGNFNALMELVTNFGTWQIYNSWADSGRLQFYFGGDQFILDTAGNGIFAKSVRATAVTYANRPATPVEGMHVAITDSNTAVWGATIAAGGANHVSGYYNGTNWVVS